MTTLTPTVPKKSRLRFKDEDDLIFLREVLGYNPFRTPDMWAVIQENVFSGTKKEFSVKTLKDHLDLLIKNWVEKRNKYKDRSGIEEDYTEKDKILEEIYGLMVEFRIPIKKKKDLGIKAREHWANENYREEVILENDNVYGLKFETLDHDYTYLENEAVSLETCHLSKKRPFEERQDNSNFFQNTNISNVDVTPENPMAPQRGKYDVFEKTNIGDVDATPEIPVAPQRGKYNVFKKINIPNVGAPTENPMAPQRGKYNVFNRNKSRARKSSVQKQGLAIVQEYDKNQNEIKRKELELRERELQLQERKLEIESRKLEMEERKEQQKEITKQKSLDVLENAMAGMTKIIQSQEKLICFIVSQKK